MAEIAVCRHGISSDGVLLCRLCRQEEIDRLRAENAALIAASGWVEGDLLTPVMLIERGREEYREMSVENAALRKEIRAEGSDAQDAAPSYRELLQEVGLLRAEVTRLRAVVEATRRDGSGWSDAMVTAFDALDDFDAKKGT